MNRSVSDRGTPNGQLPSSRRRTARTILGIAALTFAVFVLSIGLGNKDTTLTDVFRTMFGHGTDEQALVLRSLRLPRALVALLVGAALSVAGAILQGIIRNPMASPDVIGITGGAAIAAVAFIAYLAGSVSVKWLPAAAFLGAAVVSIAIYALAWHKGVSPTRLVLIGVGISAVTSSLTMLMIVLSPVNSASRAYVWLTGSVYGASWSDVYTLLPWVFVLIPLSLFHFRNLNVQGLGDELATGLGAPVQVHRFMLMMISVALAGSAVAVAGAVGFVGLIAPHMARKLVGPSFGALIPAAALLGSLMLLAADTIGRTAFLPLDIPAGVFTAAVGAPFFIYLLYRSRHRS
ncbi:FecCD family ABC transporter permease [Paenibacillaceae bacterium WGS1546]|uniref:FecCD family ABC transporter permease n=1 Tax=Cohnella sp. WGS1546 TaxID=3366810 RepID=UPI00372D0778